MAIKDISVKKFFTQRVLIFNFLFLLAAMLVIAPYIKREIAKSTQAALVSAQDLFLNSIRNDLLSGVDVSVFKKCKILLENSNITKVVVYSEVTKSTICDFEKHRSPSGDRQRISNEIYFDQLKRENKIATLTIFYSTDILNGLFSQLAFVVLVLLFMFSGVLFSIRRVLDKNVQAPLLQLANAISIEGVENAEYSFRASKIREINILSEKYQKLLQDIRDYKILLEKAAIEKAISGAAKQVAHDIRSPLSTLSILTSKASGLSDEHKSLLKLAYERIQDIADNLLQQSKEHVFNQSSVQDKEIFLETKKPKHWTPVFLKPVIEEVIKLKEVELQDRNAKLVCTISPSIEKRKSKIVASDLKNIISNLINNSVEAMEQNGFISVSLEKEDDNLLLEIRDNGKGISKEFLPQLMQEGASFGKKDGNGLGLYHAKKSIESWGGQIQIRSTVGVGTTVSIKLPIA